MRERDTNLKQGSKDTEVPQADMLKKIITDHTDESVNLYEYLLAENVAPEVARCVLPQSMFTEFIETGSLAAYARLYKLRSDPTAQREIQEYARVIGERIEEYFPISWKALTKESNSVST